MAFRIGIASLFVLTFVTPALAQSVDFTVITAVRAGDLRGDHNTAISDYVYVVDPLSRAVTMAGAAVGVPATNNRLAAIIAGTITPAGGLGLGASGRIGLGFGVTTGMAWLFVNSPKDGKGIGQVPSDLSDPFESGVARTWFVGASYTFRRTP